MAKRTTRKGALPKSEGRATVSDAATGVAALAKRINDDRVARRMTWPVYAGFIGIKLSTIYKIASGATTRPHALTVADIEAKLAANSTPTPAEGAADAVVSGGQRHPERSEN